MFRLIAMVGGLWVFASIAWLVISILRLLWASNRRSAKLHLKLAAGAVVIGVAAVLIGATNQYRDYGLESMDGLKEAQAAEAKKKAAEETRAAEKNAAYDQRKKVATNARARECHDVAEAYVMSQQFVKTRLKAPSTASFPWITDSDVSVVATKNCHFIVHAWVDSQNSFGAMLRSTYKAELHMLPDKNKWSAISVIIDE